MVARHHIFAPFLISYDPDGAMVYRKRDGVEGGLAFQRIEEYAWNAFNLLEQFTVRTDAVAEGGGPGCEPDATTMPADVWRYRFNPMQEREQKRQEITSGSVLRDGLAWTYTLLGADNKQLATYNGIEGAFCGQPSVWMWPVEYNSYGTANTRVILRPNGTKEYVIADRLGSPRITVNDQGAILQHTTYAPFGSVLTTTGTGQRTGYLGRETDNETGLGNYGVRLYEPEYGRFMSVDVLWGRHHSRNPFHYALNNPINWIDFSGLDSAQRAAAVQKAKEYLASDSDYRMGRKGQPGELVDCSGMVSNCVKAGGEKDPNRGKESSGVLNIENSTKRIDLNDAQEGNIITFRNERPKSYPYHTGIVIGVTRDADGNVTALEIIHSTGSDDANGDDGPRRQTIDPRSASALGRHVRVEGIFKWDTKPDSMPQPLPPNPAVTPGQVAEP
ncbi:MAG: RHS repeat-associated core domain-containing protein [Candidatus Kapaibacterium sp.]|nr:MAG: RHS repeat-associated core domain-containing protein [Candidatus Kapabacteria bacterium]